MKKQATKTGLAQRTKRPVRSSTRPGPKAAARRRRAAYPLYKRMMLHPLGLFALLCVGVFMAGWTYRAMAATTIAGTVEAPPLQTAATIESPVNGATMKADQIDVSGSCPLDSYVTLTINGAFNGVSWCAADNTYHITTSLYAGTNTLVVQDYNQTNEAGPTSAPAQVTYTPPASKASNSSSSTASSLSTGTAGSSTKSDSSAAVPAQAAPLLLTSNFQFHSFTSQQTFNWQLDLEGGTPPYTVTVDWGDGKISHLTFPGDPIFTIRHKYAAAGYYPVLVRSVDSTGHLHTTQLAALITRADGTAPFVHNGAATSGGNSAPVASSGSTFGPLHTNGTMKWLLIAWPSYIIILLMGISFWLGEKQEFALLSTYRRPRTRR